MPIWLTRNYETTDDAFIDGHVIEVSPRVAAQVVRLHIDDNAEVKKGDVLVELDPRDFQVALEKAQAQLVQAQAQVKQAEAGADQAKAQVVQARADLAQRAAQFEIARINYERNSSLTSRICAPYPRRMSIPPRRTSTLRRPPWPAPRPT